MLSFVTNRRLLLGALFGLLAAALGLLSCEFVVSQGRAQAGVRSLGIDLGGLDAEATRQALMKAAAPVLTRPIRVSSGSTVIPLIPSSAGIVLDAAATIDRVQAAARSGPWWISVARRARLYRQGAEAEPAFVVSDKAAWEHAVDDVALAIERLPHDAGLVLGDDGPRVVPGHEGLAIDRSALEVAVLEAVSRAAPLIDAPVSAVVPAVSTAQATLAMESARQAFSAPVDLYYQGTVYPLTPQDLADMAAVDTAGISAGHPLTFDTPSGRSLLEQRLAAIESPPIDAVIAPAHDDRGFTVIPGKDGTVVEWERLIAGLKRAAVSRDRRYVPIPTTVAPPRLTTFDAEQLGVRREIASFTTYFSADNAARLNNIRQVASILEGRIVRPGETFSFNKTVGPRTRAAGYDEAPVIRDGVLTPGVGGGICQVSTTLFNAVFFAGLPVVERHPHSFYIDHYPIGRDATVSYGGPDLKFRNDSDKIILISVSTTDGSVRVSLAAAVWDRTVTYSTTPFSALIPPASSEQKPRRLRDPDLAAGRTAPVEPGIAGRTVNVARTVERADGTVLFTDGFESVYGPKDYVVRVGG